MFCFKIAFKQTTDAFMAVINHLFYTKISWCGRTSRDLSLFSTSVLRYGPQGYHSQEHLF